jgi:hypothetical protein
MNASQKDELRRLMDQVSAAAESPDNVARLAHWRRYQSRAPSSGDPEGPICTLDIGIPTWSRLLDFDIVAYNTDTYSHIRDDLRMRLYHHEHFPDDTPVSKTLSVPSLAGNLECTLLGVGIVYHHDTNPWTSSEAVLETDDDLDRLEMPDFYKAGEMPLVHRMYAETRELVERLGYADWSVVFPPSIRGVLGLAEAMRGSHGNVLLDMLDRPDFARRLFRFAAEFRKHYATERARFLGEPIPKGSLNNDEVNTPSISPRLYEEFLLPLEIEIAEFHGGLRLWHSCGDTSKLVHLIRQIPGIEWFYTGPWTDLGPVMETFGRDTPIDIAVNVVDHVLAATAEEMEAKIRRVMAACGGAALKLRAGSTDSAFELRADLAQARLWCDVARRVARGG